MSQYYKYLAYGINSTIPRWVEPYVDAFGLGRMTTVSRAIYDRSTGSAIFVGVAEIDVPLDELTPYISESELNTELASRGKTCPHYNVTQCYMQLLRDQAGYQCPSMVTLSQCRGAKSIDEIAACSSGPGVNKMICDPLNSNSMISTSGATAYDDFVCCSGCGLSPGAIAGIVIGSVAGAALIGGAGYFFFVKGGFGAASSASGSSVATTGVELKPNAPPNFPNHPPVAQNAYPPMPGTSGYPAPHGGFVGAQPPVGYATHPGANMAFGPSAGAPPAMGYPGMPANAV
jgi:hypothetical protein